MLQILKQQTMKSEYLIEQIKNLKEKVKKSTNTLEILYLNDKIELLKKTLNNL